MKKRCIYFLRFYSFFGDWLQCCVCVVIFRYSHDKIPSSDLKTLAKKGRRIAISWQCKMPNMQQYGPYCWLAQANPEVGHHESSLWILLFPLSRAFWCVVSSLFRFVSFPVAVLTQSAITWIDWFTVVLIDLIGKNTAEVNQYTGLCSINKTWNTR